MLRKTRHVLLCHDDPAGIRQMCACNKIEQRGFTRAVPANHCEKFSFGDAENDIVNSNDLVDFTGAKHFGYSVYGYHAPFFNNYRRA